MDWFFETIAKHMKAEFTFIADASVIAAILIVMVAVAVWFFEKHLHRDTVAGLNSAIGSKDATIETLNERYKTAHEHLLLAAREKDDLVQKLGNVSALDSASLMREVQRLRAEVEERRSREWSPLSEQQIRQLVKTLKRNGKEEPVARSVSIVCNDAFADAIMLGEQITKAFVTAGWSLTKQPDPERLWQDMEKGIGVYAPKGQPVADFLMKALAGVFGESVLFRREAPSLFNGILDAAALVQIEIGRKPFPRNDNGAF